MAFDLFKKKPKKDADEPTPEAGDNGQGDDGGKKTAKGGKDDNGFRRDPKKADAFFKHAMATADARSYDYSIECYINGLRHEPANMFRHEALLEVGLKRKVSGGKPAGLRESLKPAGRDPIDKMLHSEKLWAKDPQNLSHMVSFMERAAEVYGELDIEEYDENDPTAIDPNDMNEVVTWIGEKVLESNATNPKPKKDIFDKACDVFTMTKQFDQAVQAARFSAQLASDSDTEALRRLKDLEAERTIAKSRMEDGGRSIDTQADAEGQRQRNLEDATDLAESQLRELIVIQKEQYDEKLAEGDVDQAQLEKLVRTYQRLNNDEGDEQAIAMLMDGFERTDGYHLRAKAGDLKMRQFRRHQQEIKKQIDANPDDESLKEKLREKTRERAEYELAEFAERVEKYPTQLSFKFELGRRKLQVKEFDDAIGLFQQAQQDPKIRAHCCNFLGTCYRAKEWYDEAVETLERGIDSHQLHDDALAMELRYQLMDANEQLARKHKSIERAREAQKIASQILQTNINYRDIRNRSDQLRKLIDDLQGAG